MSARILFLLAGVYNLAFAAWAMIRPAGVFELLGVTPWPPAITRLLAASIGGFGLAWLYAAKRPERATLIVALGLLSKVLPPLAWGVAVAIGAWPGRTFLLILCDDLIWWIPLGAYLIRALRPQSRTVA